MGNRGSLVKVLRKESAQDYVQNVLHMEKVRSLPSPDSDYWFFKGRNENGGWMETVSNGSRTRTSCITFVNVSGSN